MTVLYLDTETFCEVPIKNGVHAYAEEAEVMIAAWALDDGPVTVEDLTDPQPDGTVRLLMPSAALLEAIEQADEIVMHKSDFDRTVIRHAWGVEIPIEKVHDTMVQALTHGLPGGLDKLCALYKIPLEEAKSSSGKNLIQLHCKPLPKNSRIRRATKDTHTTEWREFLAYAGSDILAMRAIRRRLPSWNYQGREKELWRLDQRINDRGFLADVQLATAAVSTVRAEQHRLKHQAIELTDGALDNPRSRDPLLFYLLQAEGITLPDLKKDTLERRLEDPELSEPAKELLRVRLAATTSSTAKYAAILRALSKDGRLRGSLQFAGAKRTARWAGRLFQPQNLPRPTRGWQLIELIIDAVREGYDLDDLVGPGETMSALSDALRGMIVASPGKRIFSSDLSNIEGRVAAWLAGEQWKLDAFAAYDTIIGYKPNGKAIRAGHDLYIMAYAKSFGVPPEAVPEKGDERQIGKVQELALGYEGGVGAFLAFAAVYRMDLNKLADAVLAAADAQVIRDAEGMLAWRKKKRLATYGLSDRVFIACEIVKRGWRDGHDAISSYWPALLKAAVAAVRNPGVACYPLDDDDRPRGPIYFVKSGAWLRMVLPSGRSLCYAQPQVGEDGRLSYMGENQYNRKWQRIHTYGGKLFENACQAVARDVMAHNMPLIEEAGYEIVLTVHDDVIAEGPEHLTSEGLSSILAAPPPWLTGCPLSAGGFKALRYRKDD